MNSHCYGIKKDLGLIAKCSHGSEFDHDTEHVFNDLRPKSKKGYQHIINQETSAAFKK